MCWCTPSIRTPRCHRMECLPPKIEVYTDPNPDAPVILPYKGKSHEMEPIVIAPYMPEFCRCGKYVLGKRKCNCTPGRALYEKTTSNDPSIHCNRFPSWHELSEDTKDEWEVKAGNVQPKQLVLNFGED